jgi:N-acetylglucosamine-6-phosphate deacetylase
MVTLNTKKPTLMPNLVAATPPNDCRIINARIPNVNNTNELVIRHGQITEIAESVTTENLPTLDLGGDWISLGGVDLQINGALGLAFPDACSTDTERLTQIANLLWQQGVDEFLPTIVTTSIENIHRSLAVFTEFMADRSANCAAVAGVHLEGPFLNLDKRGAHPQSYLLSLDVNNITAILSKYIETVKVVTLAPELDPTGEVIAYLRSLGIVVSLGHSQANFDQAQAAFDRGASMVTHAFTRRCDVDLLLMGSTSIQRCWRFCSARVDMAKAYFW